MAGLHALRLSSHVNQRRRHRINSQPGIPSGIETMFRTLGTSVYRQKGLVMSEEKKSDSQPPPSQPQSQPQPQQQDQKQEPKTKDSGRGIGLHR